MNLSEYSSEVVGFDSTFDKDKEVMVRDAGTDAMEPDLKTSDSSTSTNDRKETGVSHCHVCAKLRRSVIAKYF